MFTLTADQELFEASTAHFLAAHYRSERIREMRYAQGFDPGVRKQGAELNGTVACVDAAADAHHPLVSADVGHSIAEYLVPITTPGIALAPLEGLDLTRAAGPAGSPGR